MRKIIGQLVSFLLVVMLVPPVSAEAVNPKVDQTVKSVPPGPGYPAGWQPPASPNSIPEHFVTALRQYQEAAPDQAPTSQILYVEHALPHWASEFPWTWRFDALECGKTEVVFAYPVPDTSLVSAVFGRVFGYFTNDSVASECTAGGVQAIQEMDQPSPEQQEQRRLDGQLGDDMLRARLGSPSEGGLNACHQNLTNASPDHIHVCFNGGDASERFDVNAYLDTSVNRVRVPIRFVSEMMGGLVTWDERSQTVTIRFQATERVVTQPEPLPGLTTLDRVIPESYSFRRTAYKLVQRPVRSPDLELTLTIGKPSALVGGKPVALDAAPVIKDGRTMVPLRFIAEQLGAKVYWIGATPIYPTSDGGMAGTYQVHIYTPFWPYFDYPEWFIETRAQRF